MKNDKKHETMKVGGDFNLLGFLPNTLVGRDIQRVLMVFISPPVLLNTVDSG